MNQQSTLNGEEVATLAFLLYGEHPAADSDLADRLFNEYRGRVPGTEALLPACSAGMRVGACRKGTRREAEVALATDGDGYMAAMVADRWPLVAARSPATDADTLQGIIDRTDPKSPQREMAMEALTRNPAVLDMALAQQQAPPQAMVQPS